MFFVPIVAISFWLSGYFITARTMSNRGLLSEDLEKIIAPPKWLYYLCGAPRNKEYPQGTMRVVAFRTQIMGIALMIFSLCSFIGNFSGIDYLAGLMLTILVTHAMLVYVAKKYFASEELKEPITIKRGNSMSPTKITEDLSYSIEGNSINLYSEFGSHGGANLTLDLEELEAVIETLQNIKAFLQNEQLEKTAE